MKAFSATIVYLSEVHGTITTQMTFDTFSEFEKQLKRGPCHDTIQKVVISRLHTYPMTIDEDAMLDHPMRKK